MPRRGKKQLVSIQRKLSLHLCQTPDVGKSELGTQTASGMPCWDPMVSGNNQDEQSRTAGVHRWEQRRGKPAQCAIGIAEHSLVRVNP